MRQPTRHTLFMMAVLLLVVGVARTEEVPAPRPVLFQTRTMGTVGSVTLVTADSAAVADLAYAALVSFHHTDSLMTNWTDISETARINRLAGIRTVTLEPEVNRVLTLAGQVGALSGGAFDLTVEPLVRLWGFLEGQPQVPTQAEITAALAPVGWDQVEHDGKAGTLRFRHPDTRIDLGGIAKGHGVDQVRDILLTAGVTNALVDLSGNMVALGDATGSSGWTLGIMDPEKKHDYLGSIVLRNEAVATSGNYMQYVMNAGTADSRKFGHILDPTTGWPADGMASATVVAADAAVADAWATAFIVLNPERARRLAREHDELQVILIAPVVDGTQVIWVEEALREKFALKEGLTETVAVRYF